jgi:hypothetical protein
MEKWKKAKDSNSNARKLIFCRSLYLRIELKAAGQNYADCRVKG